MADTRLQQAIAFARAGQQSAARQLLMQLVREDPNNEKAWLWLAGVAQNNSQQHDCLQQVLRINPANQQAARRLNELEAMRAAPDTVSAPTAASPAASAPPTGEQVPCDFCGTPNRVGARFCAGCGANLGGSSADQPDQQPAPSPGPGAAAGVAAGAGVAALAGGAGGAGGTGRPRVTQCEMIIGYLVPRRCDNPALAVCPNCGRSFCDEHMEVTPQGMLCIACKQGLSQPVALADTASHYDDSDIAAFAVLSSWDDDDYDDYDDDGMFSDLS